MDHEHRTQILENCRWIYNQDVRIVTFHSTRGTRYAIVLPASCPLQSLGQPGIIDKKILIHAHRDGAKVSLESVMSALLDATERRIGEIVKVERSQRFRVEKEAVPEGYFEPAPAAAVEVEVEGRGVLRDLYALGDTVGVAVVEEGVEVAVGVVAQTVLGVGEGVVAERPRKKVGFVEMVAGGDG